MIVNLNARLIVNLNVKLSPAQIVRVDTRDGKTWEEWSRWVLTTDEWLVVYREWGGSTPKYFGIEEVTYLSIEYRHRASER